jgi:hypothetical protein
MSGNQKCFLFLLVNLVDLPATFKFSFGKVDKSFRVKGEGKVEVGLARYLGGYFCLGIRRCGAFTIKWDLTLSIYTMTSWVFTPFLYFSIAIAHKMLINSRKKIENK